MATEETWRGIGEPGGGFILEAQLALTTTWTETDVRSAGFWARTDMLAQLTLHGVTADQAVAYAVIRAVDVQNLDTGDTVELSRFATAGGSAAPSPSDAYVIARTSGGGASLRYASRDEVTAIQHRSATGSAAANFVLRLDVPLPTYTSP